MRKSASSKQSGTLTSQLDSSRMKHVWWSIIHHQTPNNPPWCKSVHVSTRIEQLLTVRSRHLLLSLDSRQLTPALMGRPTAEEPEIAGEVVTHFGCQA